MIAAVALTLAFAGAQSTNPIAKEGYAIAARLVSAIKGEAEFQDSDFAVALGAEDKAALRRFAVCKAEVIDNLSYATRKDPNVLVRDFNQVAVGFHCKGVSQETPVGITLHLKGGKVEQIETHNADLMRTR